MNLTETLPMQDEARSLGIKDCRCCKQTFPAEKFVRSKAFSSGYDTICLVCSNEKVKLWRKQNPDKRKLQLQKEAKKDYNHNKHLKATYGITRQQYLELFEFQKGQCAICNKHQLEFTKRLFVDHCHTTGKVRGLLCSHCNTLLGNAKDKIEILKTAILYLEKHNG